MSDGECRNQKQDFAPVLIEIGGNQNQNKKLMIKRIQRNNVFPAEA